MNLTQLASLVFIVGLALLPSIIAAYVSGPKDWNPEFENDYR